jgi:hypothetical protein
MIAQPLSDRAGLAVGQKVHHAAPFQITQDGAVALALAPGPIVHAQHARRNRSRLLRQGPASQVAQQCVAAHYETQSFYGARSCRTAQRQSQPAQRLFHTERAPGVGVRRLRQSFRENVMSAFFRAAEKAACL